MSEGVYSGMDFHIRDEARRRVDALDAKITELHEEQLASWPWHPWRWQRALRRRHPLERSRVALLIVMGDANGRIRSAR